MSQILVIIFCSLHLPPPLRMALDYADVEVMTEQDEALVTFVNLSRVVFDSDKEGCLDCTIVADVYLRTVRDEQTTQLNVINASAAYSLNLLNIQMVCYYV